MRLIGVNDFGRSYDSFPGLGRNTTLDVLQAKGMNDVFMQATNISFSRRIAAIPIFCRRAGRILSGPALLKGSEEFMAPQVEILGLQWNKIRLQTLLVRN